MGEQAAPTPGSVGSSARVRRGRTVEECQDMIQRSLRTPMVIFLREQLEKAGCGVSDNFFKAAHCKAQMSGNYARGKGITVCSNHMHFQDEVSQVVIHELIHAYDDCRAANLNWANCAHHACSEIRAGHLSGDCNLKRELLRGHMKIKGHEQTRNERILTKDVSESAEGLRLELYKIPECIRRRVMQSMRSNPYCSEVAARDAMEAVWDTCYNDTKPFDRAP